jgi:hypothetical protein
MPQLKISSSSVSSGHASGPEGSILKIFPADKEMALKITRATRGFQAFQMLGGFLIVIGGIIMMVGYQGVIMHMVWFKIKMVVLLMIILNAIILGRPATKKLLFILRDPRTEPIASQSSPSAELFSIRRKIVLFYVLQLVFFLFIFILSSFKFN